MLAVEDHPFVVIRATFVEAHARDDVALPNHDAVLIQHPSVFHEWGIPQDI